MPQDWRKANVTFIFRNGKKEDPGKYRLVSLTSVPEKVLEQLVPETISKLPIDMEMIRNNHCGFTKEKSYFTNLITFYGDWLGG